MHEEMVSLVIETPLAEDDVGTRVLNFLNHISEIFLLHGVQFFVVLGGFNFETVLGLWFWWLEWASEDQDLSVSDLLLHLRMGEIFIKNDTLDELRILESSTSLGDDFNEIEVDIFSLQISNSEDGLHGQVGEMLLALRYNLRSESGHGALPEVLVIILEDVKRLLNLIELFDGDITSCFKTISDLKWVKTFIEKLLGLIENGSSQYDNTGRSITNFVILRC